MLLGLFLEFLKMKFFIKKNYLLFLKKRPDDLKETGYTFMDAW